MVNAADDAEWVLLAATVLRMELAPFGKSWIMSSTISQEIGICPSAHAASPYNSFRWLT